MAADPANPNRVAANRIDRVIMETRRLEAVHLLQTGVHQAEVARRAGVTRTSVYRWAQGLNQGRSAGAAACSWSA
jgi:transposase-like protein